MLDLKSIIQRFDLSYKLVYFENSNWYSGKL